MKIIKSRENDFTCYMTNPAETDVSLIPEAEWNCLAESIIEAAEEYFKQPGVEEKFQKWLRNKKINGLIE